MNIYRPIYRGRYIACLSLFLNETSLWHDILSLVRSRVNGEAVLGQCVFTAFVDAVRQALLLLSDVLRLNPSSLCHSEQQSATVYCNGALQLLSS